MNNITTSYVPAQRNYTGTKGLVGTDLSNNIVSNNNSPLPQYGTNQASRLFTGQSNTDFNISNNSGNTSSLNVGASSAGSSVMLFRSGGGSSQNAGSTQGGGFLAAGSTQGKNFSSVPIDPFSDYKEGDITHPGGSPMGDPIVNVPVGDGMLPLFLMGLAYVSIVYRKRYRRKMV